MKALSALEQHQQDGRGFITRDLQFCVPLRGTFLATFWRGHLHSLFWRFAA
jgi:hypothetical protein